VAIEPNGPPFQNAGILGTAAARPWGITEIPVSYLPSVVTPSQITRSVVTSIASRNFTCWQQTSPARKLINLAKIPVLLVTSESGDHATYDSCTADYLNQAGVATQHVNLGDRGIHGNGHMMFMEKNSDVIVSQVVEPWISQIAHG